MIPQRPKVFAIIPAAGSGTRLGGIRKQFAELAGKPILVHTLQQFEFCPDVDEVAVAVPESDIAETEQLISRYRLLKVGTVVAGGRERQDSVYNALRALTMRPNDIALVHDGVRPFIHPTRISEIVSRCLEHDAVVMAVQPKDTIRRSNGGAYFDQTLDRNALWLVQTPQGFRAGILLKAFHQAQAENFYSTDEAALVERLGIKANIIEGSYDNIKITTQEDLELGSLILKRWESRSTATQP
jgi:2-C-methyl-D-erythritol 4-phosphate cytidylyltransferase